MPLIEPRQIIDFIGVGSQDRHLADLRRWATFAGRKTEGAKIVVTLPGMALKRHENGASMIRSISLLWNRQSSTAVPFCSVSNIR
jgi:hypothetical protein